MLLLIFHLKISHSLIISILQLLYSFCFVELSSTGWKFDGSGYIEYQTQFYRSIRCMVLETSFRPWDNAGLLLFASQYINGSGSYILLQLREQSLEFGLSTGDHKILLKYVYKYFMVIWYLLSYMESCNFYSGMKYERLESLFNIRRNQLTLQNLKCTNITHQPFRATIHMKIQNLGSL